MSIPVWAGYTYFYIFLVENNLIFLEDIFLKKNVYQEITYDTNFSFGKYNANN